MRSIRTTWLVTLVIVSTLAACAEPTSPTHNDCSSGGGQEWTKCAVSPR